MSDPKAPENAKIETARGVGRDLSILTYPELGNFLLKRVIALPGKLIGFKPTCLALATVLLHKQLIGEWVWFSVLVVVMFGIVGLRTIQAVFNR